MQRSAAHRGAVIVATQQQLASSPPGSAAPAERKKRLRGGDGRRAGESGVAGGLTTGTKYGSQREGVSQRVRVVRRVPYAHGWLARWIGRWIPLPALTSLEWTVLHMLPCRL